MLDQRFETGVRLIVMLITTNNCENLQKLRDPKEGERGLREEALGGGRKRDEGER